jgi:hypothetical protein
VWLREFYSRRRCSQEVSDTWSSAQNGPDFVPVLGYLDDLVLIPAGIALAMKSVPDQVLIECRARAQEIIQNEKPVSRVAAAVIVVIWLALAALCFVWVYEAFIHQFN